MNKGTKFRIVGGLLVLVSSALGLYFYGTYEVVLIWSGIIGFYMLTRRQAP